MDMQRILILLFLKSKRAFFTSRLVCFNETFASLSGSAHYSILWHEGIARRNAEDVTSAFASFIMNHSEYRDFIFWADNCTVQNKNSILFSTFVLLKNTVPTLNSITLKYLETGHTYAC